MITLINYANEPYKPTQKYCTQSAYKVGGVDKVIEYGPEDIDAAFYKKNQWILSQKRGGGLWLWKPYIIVKTLETLEDGDYLIYLDSGAYFVDNANYLIKALDSSGQDILCFDLGGLMEKQYTKPDVFRKMNLEGSKYEDTSQRLATMIVCKKNKFTIDFFKEYLTDSQKKDLIYDGDVEENKKNHPYYIAHREDQSIYSLLTKKYGLKGFRNPSQWGVKRGLGGMLMRKLNIEKTEDYPVVVIVHRGKVVNIKTRLKVFIQQGFPKLCAVVSRIG